MLESILWNNSIDCDTCDKASVFQIGQIGKWIDESLEIILGKTEHMDKIGNEFMGMDIDE